MKQAKFDKHTGQRIRIRDDMPLLYRHLHAQGYKLGPAPKDSQLLIMLRQAAEKLHP